MLLLTEEQGIALSSRLAPSSKNRVPFGTNGLFCNGYDQSHTNSSKLCISKRPAISCHKLFVFSIPAIMCIHSMYLMMQRVYVYQGLSESFEQNILKVSYLEQSRWQQQQADLSGEFGELSSDAPPGFEKPIIKPLEYDSFQYSPLETDRGIAIFYNIYIPLDQENELRAHDVIRDQVQQLRESYALESGKVSLYYVTIGKMLPDNFMKKICKKQLDCKHVQHYDQAFEEATLQRVHDFCQEYSHLRVMFIHSKGSYRPMEIPQFSQTAFRRHMMYAVTSKYCIPPPNITELEGTCNACGLLALPWPMIHFSGNFFTAKCDYVRKLVPPKHFAQRMAEVVKDSRLRLLEGWFVSNLLPPMPHYYGIDRYAMDHWLGSHPTFIPCDVSTVSDIKSWYKMGPTSLEFKFAMFPRHSINAPWSYMNPERLKATLKFADTRLREYFLLPGYIHRWLSLYNELPPRNSWFWSFFPDGPLWSIRSREAGMQAIELVAQPFIVA